MLKRNWLKKVAIGSLAVICSVVSTISTAQASNRLSGVSLPGGSNKGQSTFLSTDPAYLFYPTYLLQAGKNPFKSSVGVNLPARNFGNNILPNVGNFNFFEFYYDVPNFGASVDPGLTAVIQTSDGFSRFAQAQSFIYDSSNGFNVYYVPLDPNQFSPSFNAGTTALRTLSIRYASTFGRPMYWIYPVLYGTNDTLYYDDFTYNTQPDQAFNNN